MSRKLAARVCSGCGAAERLAGQRYCRGCRNEAVRKHRLRVREELQRLRSVVNKPLTK